MRRRTRRREEDEEEEEEGLLTSNDECRSVGTGRCRAFLLESAQIRSHVAVSSYVYRPTGVQIHYSALEALP